MRLLDFDPFTGVSTYHGFDHQTDKTIIHTTQDAEPYLNLNKIRQNDDDYSKNGKKNNWWHVASIPIGVQLKWLKEEGIDIFDKNHRQAVKRKLNSSEYKYLRTSTGKI